MLKLDDLDRKILNELQKEDACTPKVSRIAIRVGAPATTVQQRIKKLTDGRAIRGYKADVDGKNVGKGITTFMLAKIDRGKKADIDEIGRNLCKIPNVQEVFFITGEWDFLVKVKIANIDEYYNFSSKYVIQTPGIVESHSITVPKTFKEDSAVEV